MPASCPQSREHLLLELDELRLRSRLLIYQLAEKQDIVFLPTIAVAELLVPVPVAQKGVLIASLQQRFICPPFDLPAAAIASEVWSRHNSLPADLRYDKRHVLKADAMIIGSARAAGATDFYSHDRKCRALAGLVMKAHDLPTRDPNDMFLLNEIKQGQMPALPPPSKPKRKRKDDASQQPPGSS
jgi:hypothetical protein